MILPIDERIPEMTDSELANLHSNALRLKETGAAPVRAEAERILPLVAATLELRRVARNEALQKQKLERREAASAKRLKKKAESKPDPG
jgi:hypothetical protein